MTEEIETVINTEHGVGREQRLAVPRRARRQHEHGAHPR